MRRIRRKTRIFLVGLLALICGLLAIAFVVQDENTLVFHPRGVIAHGIYQLIITNICLMLSIILPTYILLFWIVWKYCLRNDKDENPNENPPEYDPEHTFGPFGQALMWILPACVVVVLATVTWYATHDLNPYKPIASENKPFPVQVVALDWKWLFIYPELGIATLNELHIPEKTPIHFKLTADESPMNSFWVPQLSGQIYSMTGMTTQLFLMADHPGTYSGKAVEINGEGYADMTFSVISNSAKDFEDWVANVKKSPLRLTKDAYKALVQRGINKSILLFSDVEDDLFRQIIQKYMYPTKPVL